MSSRSPMSTAAAVLRSAPGRCEVCRSWADGGLCSACRALFAAPVARCTACALPLPGAGASVCAACLHRPFAFSHCVAVADYGYPWDRLIGAFKFYGRVDLAMALAICLDEAIARATSAGEWPVPALVVPVPLSAARLRERGYNQAWELARRTARLRRLATCADLVLRWRDTAHQTNLPLAERERNLRQAFVVTPAGRSALRHVDVALVDDVLTSGATATAVASALLEAGARSVQVWVIARTPPPQA